MTSDALHVSTIIIAPPHNNQHSGFQFIVWVGDKVLLGITAITMTPNVDNSFQVSLAVTNSNKRPIVML